VATTLFLQSRIFPGFRRFSGSKAFLMARMSSSSAGEREKRSDSFLRSPIPCSPEMLPSCLWTIVKRSSSVR
jgi:hypothetical protein